MNALTPTTTMSTWYPTCAHPLPSTGEGEGKWATAMILSEFWAASGVVNNHYQRSGVHRFSRGFPRVHYHK